MTPNISQQTILDIFVLFGEEYKSATRDRQKAYHLHAMYNLTYERMI